MTNFRNRVDHPKNPERLVALEAKEIEHILPMKPDWALCGIGFNPRTGSVMMHIRQDGLPAEDPSLGGGRIYIAIEADPEEIAGMAQDIAAFFKSRGVKRAKVGYIDSPEAQALLFVE